MSNKFAFVDDDSVNEVPKNLAELNKAGRGGSKKGEKKTLGRPRVENKKNQGVWVYLNDKQKALLEEKARESGLSLSQYIVVRIFGIKK